MQSEKKRKKESAREGIGEWSKSHISNPAKLLDLVLTQKERKREKVFKRVGEITSHMKLACKDPPPQYLSIYYSRETICYFM